jgi:hypothetical protein
VDDDVAVELVNRDQICGLGTDRLGDRPAVAAHRSAVVIGAETAIERGVEALRMAALAGEEAVAHPSDLSQSGSLDHGSPRVKGNGGGRSG